MIQSTMSGDSSFPMIGNVTLNRMRNNPFDESSIIHSSPSLNDYYGDSHYGGITGNGSINNSVDHHSNLQPSYSHYPNNDYNNNHYNNNTINHYNNNRYHRLDEMERRLISEKQTIQFMSKIFNWIESTNLYKTSIQYVNEWRIKMSRNSSYVMNENLISNPIESKYYYGNYNQSTAIYSRHESFIKSIIDSIITFKRTLLSSINGINNNQQNNMNYQDSQLALDIANRIDKYTLQERKYFRNNQFNNNYGNQQYTIMDRFKKVIDSILHILKIIFFK